MQDVKIIYEKDFDEDDPINFYAKVEAPEKFKNPFTVYNPKTGTALYYIRQESTAAIAKALSGAYTKPELALKDVLKYIEKSKESKAVARDRKADARAKSKAKNSTS